MFLSGIYPKPSVYKETGGEPFAFKAKLTVSLSSAVGKTAAKHIKELWNSFTFTASELTVTESTEEGFVFRTGEADCPVPGYYGITVNSKGICIRGISEKALLDGFSVLVQLIAPVCLEYGHEQLRIPAAEVSDVPSISFRAVHICVFPESDLFTIKKAIALSGFLGFTHIVLEFWGMFRYEASPFLSWDRAFTKQQLRPLTELARNFGLEVIPMLNHFGHATQSRVSMGRHTILNQNPRMQMYFEPDGWTWCLSNPDTYRLLSEMRAELTEFCGSGSYFHLGFDEAYSFATCDLCKKKIPHELLAEYLNRLTDDLAKDGRRPIIWHDQLVKKADFASYKEPLYASGDSKETWKALELTDRRVIIADWQYETKRESPPTAEYLKKQGFDVVLSPWDDSANVKCLCDTARRISAYGVMLTTWHHLPSILPKLYGFAESVRGSDAPGAPWTEAAALLRKVCPTGDFEHSGWNKEEVEQ